MKAAVATIGIVGAGGCSSATAEGSTAYTVTVQIKGAAAGFPDGAIQVCVDYASGGSACGADNKPFKFNSTDQINLKANPGEAYMVVVPKDQQLATSCAVTSGGSGAFGPSMETAVVTCA